MRAILTSFALMFLVSVVTAAEPTTNPAAGNGGARHKLLHGIVKKVDGKTITLSIGKGDAAKEVEVVTDDATEFTLDHKPAKLEDVKEGEVAAVAPAEGVAHHVDVNTAHHGHHKDAGAGTGTGGTGTNTGSGNSAGGSAPK